jgi:hypothetical protein
VAAFIRAGFNEIKKKRKENCAAVAVHLKVKNL